MTDRLSPAQINALGVLSDGKLTDFAAAMFIGRSREKTLRSLEERGLVVYQPYALDRRGAWALTAEGRARVDAYLATGELVREEEK